MAALGQRDILIDITKKFKNLQLPFLLTGSFVVSFYGQPRATHDIDFIIEIRKKNLDKLKLLFSKLGKDYSCDLSDVENPPPHSFQFNIYHPSTGVKIDFWMVKDNDFEKNKFKRKKEITMDKIKIPIVSAEDLILNKLLWSKEIISERHLKDCQGIIKVQGEKLDYKYLETWAKKLGISQLLKSTLQSTTHPPPQTRKRRNNNSVNIISF